MAATRVGPAALAAPLLLALTTACGGGAEVRPAVTFGVPSAAEATAESAITLPATERCATLDRCVAEVVDALVDAGFADAAPAEAIGPATGLVTAGASSSEPLRVLVRIAPWTPESVDAAVAAHYRDGLSSRSLVVGPDRPFGIDYLLGDSWWSALESDLYSAFADPSLDPDEPGPYIARARAALEAYGANPEDPLGSVQVLLDALPRPAEGDGDYLPIATLLAAGLVIGDEVRRGHPRLVWVDGESAMARYFALRDRHDERRIFRPIDYAVQVYRTPIPGSVAAYAELVDVRTER